MKRIFNLDERVSVDNYPYGRLKCTATFGLEYKEGKGYRTIFQTVNPKTGRINNPKKSVYQPLIWMVQDTETGFVTYEHVRFDGFSSYEDNMAKVREWWDTFTVEERSNIFGMLYAHFKITAIGAIQFGLADKETVLEYFAPFIKTAAAGFKEPDISLLDGLNVDFDYVRSLENRK